MLNFILGAAIIIYTVNKNRSPRAAVFLLAQPVASNKAHRP
jgi:hypothetical protein